MNTRRSSSHPAIGAAVASVVLALSLAGCDRGGSGASDTTPPASSTSDTGSASGSSSTSSGSSSTSSPGTSTSPPTATAGQRCRATALRPGVAASDAAAGSTYLTISLTNTGTVACSLRGYPGVSIVGHGNGTQIGAAAQRDTTASSVSVTLAAGHATTFVLRIAQAGNYPAASCSPVAGDGLRIYPPDSTEALFLARTGLTGCAKSSVNVLTVRPVGVKAG